MSTTPNIASEVDRARREMAGDCTSTSKTPRTDACLKYDLVPAELARQLEHELAAANERADNAEALGIHTCHENCQRPMCVMRRERDEARVQLKDMTDQFLAVSQQCERMKDQTSAGYVFNQMRRAWEALGEGKWEYRPHKFVEICEKMKAQLAAARDVIAGKDEALAFIKRTVKTDQLCSKGNESIWFAADEALALTVPTAPTATPASKEDAP